MQALKLDPDFYISNNDTYSDDNPWHIELGGTGGIPPFFNKIMIIICYIHDCAKDILDGYPLSSIFDRNFEWGEYKLER